jgi:hypothetical protein
LLAPDFAPLAAGAEAIRVPKPAAGIITTTFMRAISIYETWETSSIDATDT